MTFNVGSGSLQSVVQEAQQAIATIGGCCRLGVFVEFTGAAEAEVKARNELMLYSATGAWLSSS